MEPPFRHEFAAFSPFSSLQQILNPYVGAPQESTLQRDRQQASFG